MSFKHSPFHKTMACRQPMWLGSFQFLISSTIKSGLVQDKPFDLSGVEGFGMMSNKGHPLAGEGLTAQPSCCFLRSCLSPSSSHLAFARSLPLAPYNLPKSGFSLWLDAFCSCVPYIPSSWPCCTLSPPNPMTLPSQCFPSSLSCPFDLGLQVDLPVHLLSTLT